MVGWVGGGEPGVPGMPGVPLRGYVICFESRDSNLGCVLGIPGVPWVPGVPGVHGMPGVLGVRHVSTCYSSMAMLALA